MEGVHVGGTPQEPLVQNDQEDEVDAGQEVQPHVQQQEDQVEALWVQVGGRAETGLAAGEGRLPSRQWPQFLETLMRERWQAGWNPNIQLATGLWGLGHPFSLPYPSTPDLVGLLSGPFAHGTATSWNAIPPPLTWGPFATVQSSVWTRATYSCDAFLLPGAP